MRNRPCPGLGTSVSVSQDIQKENCQAFAGPELNLNTGRGGLTPPGPFPKGILSRQDKHLPNPIA